MINWFISTDDWLVGWLNADGVLFCIGDAKFQLPGESKSAVCSMISVNDEIWMATKDGRLFVYDTLV